jgi:hypothetical protein
VGLDLLIDNQISSTESEVLHATTLGSLRDIPYGLHLSIDRPIVEDKQLGVNEYYQLRNTKIREKLKDTDWVLSSPMRVFSVVVLVTERENK